MYKTKTTSRLYLFKDLMADYGWLPIVLRKADRQKATRTPTCEEAIAMWVNTIQEKLEKKEEKERRKKSQRSILASHTDKTVSNKADRQTDRQTSTQADS